MSTTTESYDRVTSRAWHARPSARRAVGSWRSSSGYCDVPVAMAPRRFIVAVVVALIALLAPGVAMAAPGPKAVAAAQRFVANKCPSYDTTYPGARGALEAVFQRMIDTRTDKDRVEFQPVQVFAAAAELETLKDYCSRPGVKRVWIFPKESVPSPDIGFELAQPNPDRPTECVEVVAVTGRFQGYQRPPRTDPKTSRRYYVGTRPPTSAHVENAVNRKIKSGQLTSPRCPKGGTIALHVARTGVGRRRHGTVNWATIAQAIGNSRAALDVAPHVHAIEIRGGATRLDLERDPSGQMAVVAKPDARASYQRALRLMMSSVPTIDLGGGRGAPLTAPGLSAPSGAAIAQVSRGAGATGGIDFSSLELRYIGDRSGHGLRYAFRAPAGPGDSADGLRTAQDASDAFFVWLALSRQQFWVNLNPTEPNRIIDPVFARSAAGRVLLSADLALKKVVAPLVHPGTPSGAQFWRELEALYEPRPDQACFSVRQWIVPAPATVYEDRDELYILESPLNVKMESEFVGGFPGGGCPPGNEAFETLKEGIYRRLILPSVVQAVNTAPEFAPLRRVYTSRIAAEWFRTRHGRDRSPIGRIADSGNISRWPAVPAWNPQDVFNSYVSSVQNGEWSVDRQIVINGQQYVLNTVFGGVDFSRTPTVKVARHEFVSRWPKLATRVRQSMTRPVTDTQRAVWIGAQSR